MTIPELLWPSANRQDFFQHHLVPHLDRLEENDPPDPAACTWRTRDELLADGAVTIERQRRRLIGERQAPAPAAAKYLAEWYGAPLGRVVGLAYGMAGAGLLVDGSVRWREHPEGWVDRVDVRGCTVAVAVGHPWAGQDGVLVVADDDSVRVAVLQALREVLTPVLAACREGARVGWASVWAEVGDGLGLALANCPYPLPEAGRALEPLRRLVHTRGAPWRKHPQAWMGPTAHGWLFMGRKGGCCLAYTAALERADPDDASLGEFHRAWLRRFPDGPPDPGYCSMCCFRDLADVEQRQRFWLEHHLRAPASPACAAEAHEKAALNQP